MENGLENKFLKTSSPNLRLRFACVSNLV